MGWQLRLSEYDLLIVHVKGKENVLADGLSSLPADSIPYGRPGKEDLWSEAVGVSKANNCRKRTIGRKRMVGWERIGMKRTIGRKCIIGQKRIIGRKRTIGRERICQEWTTGRERTIGRSDGRPGWKMTGMEVWRISSFMANSGQRMLETVVCQYGAGG